MSFFVFCPEPVQSGVVVHSECLERLKTKQLDDKPLTLEELHAVMDSGSNGLHIWIQEIKYPDLWPGVIDRKNGQIVGVIGADPACFYWEIDYGKTWLAYRNKPEDE